ncbi:endonuclease/exonuclease/phosphatase family protein [Dongia sedimenti]|uniref:Endonuclease/exonuclease/phosphatase family protein n=1 Tax=Dongia sedimenti TaxID=3064282 RepID=A0ABU0YQZ9_9PROT|nr:endonuclease/exonuclease/phosphatase family protein [Rhodospirillaceae bacterium R-7]
MPSFWENRARYFHALARLTAIGLWMSVLLLLGAAILPWLAGLPWPQSSRAWLTVIENLRLPIAAAALIIAVTSLVLRRGRLVVAASFAIALCGVPVVASIQGQPPVAAETPTLKVVTFNIWTRNRQFDRILAYLREEQPDIVFLEELKEKHKQVFASLSDLYPTQVTCHESTTNCETMLLSRFPARRQHAGRIDGALPSTALAELDVDGRTLTAIAVHVVWPFPFRGQDAQRQQVLHLAQSLQAVEGPLLIGGDFNGGAWVRNQRDLRELTGLSGEPGFHPTWPALPIHGIEAPQWLRLPIDHLFSRGGPVIIAAELGPELGSDHLPLMARVAWPPATRASPR